MTFGIESPGFDLVYCPPCPDGMLCNMICIDLLNFFLSAATIFISAAVFIVVSHELRSYRFHEVADE